jgi:hypothetical protein
MRFGENFLCHIGLTRHHFYFSADKANIIKQYTVKKGFRFSRPQPGEITNQTLPGRELLNY